jgi:hypothetical protein
VSVTTIEAPPGGGCLARVFSGFIYLSLGMGWRVTGEALVSS